jgi:pyruvate dehydrogenase E2 component (dihydrolipoamide acetyltransferase)
VAGDWEIVMPRLSDTMTEGVVSRWLRSLGDRVEQGEPLVEIETEKASMDIVSEAAGYLVEIRAVDGAEVPTGGVIGVVAPELRVLVEQPGPPSPAAPAPAATGPAPGAAPAADDPENGNGRLRASPVARKLARELGVDLDRVEARGPLGRILRTDVERAARAGAAAERGGEATQAVSRRHLAMARRMATAKQAIPHFYLSVEIDATRLQQLRDELKRGLEPATVSVTALVVKAAASALRQVPAVNSSWQDDGLRLNERVNVGVAVALENGELVVPVVADADTRTPVEIHAEVVRLAERARRLELTEAELSGGTFTVSNLGMLGVDAAYAIVNPPESGILAVGAVRETVAFRAGEAVPAQALTLGLSGDHRAYSGATGAEFLRALRAYLENPVSLFLDPGR